jgi:hypothetical protein
MMEGVVIINGTDQDDFPFIRVQAAGPIAILFQIGNSPSLLLLISDPKAHTILLALSTASSKSANIPTTAPAPP